MTQYYALEGAAAGNSVKVVIHIQVPGTNNAVGVAWSSVAADYKTSRTGDTVSAVPTSMLEPGAQTALDTGTLYEHEFIVRDDVNAAPATRLTNLETAVTAEAIKQLAILQNQLNYWGQKGDA